MHIVVGTAGAFQHEKWVDPIPPWSARRFANGNCSTDNNKNTCTKYTDTFGYGHLKIENSTYLEFEFVPITGNIHESFIIVKGGT